MPIIGFAADEAVTDSLHRQAEGSSDFPHGCASGPGLIADKNARLPNFEGMCAMARGRKTSPADDLFELVAMLPWWAGVALAVVSYAILHRLAGQQVAMTAVPGQMGSAIAASLWKSLASVGQYVLPIICLAAAVGSALSRRRRLGLVATVASSDAPTALDGMTWREFEMLVEGVLHHLDPRRPRSPRSRPQDGGAHAGARPRRAVLREHRRRPWRCRR